VDMRAREVRVRAEVAKSRKRRDVPLFERAMELLRDLPISNRSPYVFVPQGEGIRYSEGSPTMYEALQKAVRRANKARKLRGDPEMAHVEWHDLRRTCGCRLLQDRGFAMHEVQKWMGHSSVQVTERHYAFLETEQLHKRRRQTKGEQ
jgi:integrase/recombinase XerD